MLFCCFNEAKTLFLMNRTNGKGLVLSPLYLRLKCKWSPVERPVLPDIPKRVPGVTTSLGDTKIEDK